MFDRLPLQIQRNSKTAGGALPIPDAATDQLYRASYANFVRMVKKLYDNGITIVAGTDRGSGYALHREVEIYNQAGIPAPQSTAHGYSDRRTGDEARQRTRLDAPLMNSFSGTAPSRDCRSTRLSLPATAFSLRIGSSRRERSIDDLLQTTTRLRGRRRWLAQSELAAGIRRVKGAKKLGVRLGNWAHVRGSPSLPGSRLPQTRSKERGTERFSPFCLAADSDAANWADLDFAHLQQREEHWAIVDLVGKGGHIRTVPVPE